MGNVITLEKYAFLKQFAEYNTQLVDLPDTKEMEDAFPNAPSVAVLRQAVIAVRKQMAPLLKPARKRAAKVDSGGRLDAADTKVLDELGPLWVTLSRLHDAMLREAKLALKQQGRRSATKKKARRAPNK